MKLFKLILLCLFLFSKAHANTIYELIKIPNLEVYNIKTENKLRYLYAKQPFTIGVDNNINCFNSAKKDLKQKINEIVIIKDEIEVQNSAQRCNIDFKERTRLPNGKGYGYDFPAGKVCDYIIPLKENYILIEMSYLDKPTFLYEILFNLKINGYIPVLAHPERYGFLFSDFQNFLKLKGRGCKFQINLLC